MTRGASGGACSGWFLRHCLYLLPQGDETLAGRARNWRDVDVGSFAKALFAGKSHLSKSGSAVAEHTDQFRQRLRCLGNVRSPFIPLTEAFDLLVFF